VLIHSRDQTLYSMGMINWWKEMVVNSNMLKLTKTEGNLKCEKGKRYLYFNDLR